jgi:hypothetical protein
MIPYLPEIMRCVVERVDKVLSNKDGDPFSVFFTHGIYSQVNKYVADHPDDFPLVWLMTNYDESSGRDFSVHSDVTCSLFIAEKTDDKWTQEERDEKTIIPRLYPVYEELIKQISAEPQIKVPPINQIQRRVLLKPYWGGADIDGTNTENLFKQFVDALLIKDLKLQLKHSTKCGFKSQLLK